MTQLSFDTRRIRAISLDLDDTLWPIVPTIVRAEEQLKRWLALHAPATATLAAQGAANKLARDFVLAHHADKLHDFSHLRRETIRHLLGQAGEDPALAEPAFEEFFSWRQKVDLYADALPALQALAAKYPLVALSNGNADIERVGLGPYFQGAISARAFGLAKPAPQIFAAVADHLSLPMDAVLHVGDDPELDVAGALAAGQHAAWVNREDRSWPQALPEPSLHVRDMGELARLLLAA